MTTEYVMVICNCPDHQVAEQLSETLVSEKLAACVNIMPEMKSVYRWQSEVENDLEVQIQIKTILNLYDKLRQRIEVLHPYEVPEIIAIPILRGNPSYMQWITENTDS